MNLLLFGLGTSSYFQYYTFGLLPTISVPSFTLYLSLVPVGYVKHVVRFGTNLATSISYLEGLN